MNKVELIKLVAEAQGTSRAAAEDTIRLVLDAVVDAAITDGRSTFGKHIFTKGVYKERKGHNPSTGEDMIIPEKTFVKHKFSNRPDAKR